MGRGSKLGRKRRVGLIACVLLPGVIAAPLASGSFSAGELDSSRAAATTKGPKVVCVTEFKPPRGQYRYKPRKCVLHQRGEFPIAGVNTATMSRLRWKSWRPGKARGKGKLFISTYGPAPATVKLTKPRKPCGEKVFTKARIKYKVRVDGDTRRGGGTLKIDNCLR